MQAKEFRSLQEASNGVINASPAMAEEVETEEVETNEFVLEYFNNYFGGNLTEDTTNEDIMDAVEDLVMLTEAVCDAVGIDEGSMGMKRLLRKSKGIAKMVKRGEKMGRNYMNPKTGKIGSGVTVSHDTGDAAREIIRSKAVKVRDQLSKKQDRRWKKGEEHGVRAIAGDSKQRAKSGKVLKHMDKQDRAKDNIGDAKSKMTDVADRVGMVSGQGNVDQKTADKAVKDRSAGHDIHKRSIKHGLKLTASTWYPNNDIIVENVDGQYRAKEG